MMRNLLLFFVAACSTVSAAERDACQAVVAREAECTDAFIPMLVDARIKLDRPAGIRDGDRGELIVAAKAEWLEDSKPAAVERTCSKKKVAEATAAAYGKCLKQTTCDAFVKCVAPLVEQTL